MDLLNVWYNQLNLFAFSTSELKLTLSCDSGQKYAWYSLKGGKRKSFGFSLEQCWHFYTIDIYIYIFIICHVDSDWILFVNHCPLISGERLTVCYAIHWFLLPPHCVLHTTSHITLHSSETGCSTKSMQLSIYSHHYYAAILEYE